MCLSAFLKCTEKTLGCVFCKTHQYVFASQQKKNTFMCFYWPACVFHKHTEFWRNADTHWNTVWDTIMCVRHTFMCFSCVSNFYCVVLWQDRSLRICALSLICIGKDVHEKYFVCCNQALWYGKCPRSFYFYIKVPINLSEIGLSSFNLHVCWVYDSWVSAMI